MEVKVLIMAGGRGERFWPLSRMNQPKQCIALFNKKTLIQSTVERLSPLVNSENIYISTGVDLQEQIMGLCHDINNFIIEPMPKDTAVAIGLAALKLSEDEDCIMIVLPSDHYIEDKEFFINHLKTGIEFAKQDKLVTIGIKPNAPSTGYGYIKPGKLIKEEGIRVFDTESFVEKPDEEKAKEFVQQGYLWNSGMFIWKCSVILNEIQKHMPELYEGLMRIKEARGTYAEFSTIENVFQNVTKTSIDYGIMEHVTDDVVVEGTFDWDDVGTWRSLERHFPKDEDGNAVQGKFCGFDSKNNIVYSSELIATVGINDLIIVDTADAVLICPKNRAEDVKKLVQLMKEKKECKGYTE